MLRQDLEEVELDPGSCWQTALSSALGAVQGSGQSRMVPQVA